MQKKKQTCQNRNIPDMCLPQPSRPLQKRMRKVFYILFVDVVPQDMEMDGYASFISRLFASFSFHGVNIFFLYYHTYHPWLLTLYTYMWILWTEQWDLVFQVGAHSQLPSFNLIQWLKCATVCGRWWWWRWFTHEHILLYIMFYEKS